MLNDKKTIRGWAMYDWANSVYALVISTAVFPPYFTSVTSEELTIVGQDVTNSAFYTFIVSGAHLFLALLIPLLSGIADYGDKKKMFLRIFAYSGSIACMVMFWFQGDNTLIIGSLAFLVATIGFGGSIVFYDAYLPQIASADRYDFVSAKGYTYGYIGSVICLLGILVIVLKPDLFGITDTTLPVRLGFIIVGIWWIGFATYAFTRLPDDNSEKLPKGLVKKGISELRNAYKFVSSNKNIKRFLLSYFFYNAGVYTVIYVATVFGEVELNMDTTELIIIVLIIQLVAIGGAYLFAYVAKLYNNKFSLIAMILIWIGICCFAYFITEKAAFYVIAACVGMVIGGIQSMSRSSYAKLLNNKVDEVTSCYSFYDFLTKISIVGGTFIYGLVEVITGSLRNSVIALGLFFVVALFLMMGVSFKNDEPEVALKL